MFRKTLLAGAILTTIGGFALANYQQGTVAYQEGRYNTAYIEFKESAASGHAAAQYMLARMYQDGRGTDRDLVQAYAWYDLSALAGYSPAATARDALAPQLTSNQLQAATNLASTWRHDTRTADGGSSAPAPAAYAAPYTLRNVQSALNQLGYAAGAVDGLIGAKTRGAIRAYQIDAGLPVSGEPSVALHQHLQAALSGQAGPAQPATPAGPSPVLISEVQGELRLRGYDIPAINGRLDAVTVTAIKRYQADASLAVDGKVSDTLLTQLRSGRTDAAVDYRAQVKSVQLALNARGYDAGPADGALGPRTRGAIRSYQVASGLTASGAIDANLLQSLGMAANATPTGVPAGSTLIAAIEDALMQRGYAAGAMDGVLDKQARNAIAQYQKDAGLTVTGQASGTLLDSLRASSLRNDSDTLSQQVWQVETLLDQNGYRVGPIDGTLDTVTREGIEDFQKDAGLKVNGKASDKLLSNLQAASNTSGGLNASIEGELVEHGYAAGVVDGVLDAQARDAIMRFQDDAGLSVTGQTSQALLTTLRASSVMNDSDTLSQLVWQVESLLDDKGYRVGKLDGTLDAETREGIEDFQKDAGLKVNGKVSNKLLASLQDAGVSGGSDGGSINQLTARQVWELEVRLDARGYDVGAVDQVADSKTHAGVLNYQRDEGLPLTGRIDQALLLRLQQADASQQRSWNDLSGEEKGLVIMESLIKSVAPQIQ